MLPGITVRSPNVPVSTAVVKVGSPVSALLRSRFPPARMAERPLRMSELREPQLDQGLATPPPLQVSPSEHLLAKARIGESGNVSCPGQRFQAKRGPPGVDTQGGETLPAFLRVLRCHGTQSSCDVRRMPKILAVMALIVQSKRLTCLAVCVRPPLPREPWVKPPS